MEGKGKFKLFSYVIEEELIFYSSLNKNRKFIAFTLILTEDIKNLIEILTKNLNKRFIKYFSVQIDILNESNLFIVNFEEESKSRILKLYNILKDSISRSNLEYEILKSGPLERDFEKILMKHYNSSVKIHKKTKTISISKNNDKNLFDLFILDLFHLEKKSFFIQKLTNLFKRLKRDGNLIFNFKINKSENIIINSYFIDIRHGNDSPFNIDKIVNNFLGFNLLIKKSVSMKKIFYILWRSNLSNLSFLLMDYSYLFLSKNEFNFENVSEFNICFEHKLTENHINFKRINQNILLINDRYIFLSFLILDFKNILRILKKYYSKYIIYILILDLREYNKLKKIEKLKNLENIKLISKIDFQKMNIKKLKERMVLKNTQIYS